MVHGIFFISSLIFLKITILNLNQFFYVLKKPVDHGSIYPTFTSFLFVKEEFVQRLKIQFILIKPCNFKT